MTPNRSRLIYIDVRAAHRYYSPQVFAVRVRREKVPLAQLPLNAVYGNKVIAGGHTPVVRRAWQSTAELIAHAKECCVVRELTDAEREQFGLPER